MKKLIQIASFVYLSIVCSLVSAQGSTMTADAFNQLLSGNTMNGVWGEYNYKQYFNPNGETTYQEEGKPETYGTWRINDEGQFCSIWPPSADEYCYVVLKDDETLLWEDGRGNVYPATVEVGNTF